MAAFPIPAAKMARYREGLRQRINRRLTPQEQAALEAARRAARQIAERLVNRYGAKRVVLFGSVARGRALRPDSDIDLAVEGMPVREFYRIVGDLYAEDGRVIDLVRLENLRESYRKVIALEGIVLTHGGD